MSVFTLKKKIIGLTRIFLNIRSLTYSIILLNIYHDLT